MPDLEFFDIDNMNEEGREHCALWHHDESARIKPQGDTYNLCKEMLKYCYDNCFMLSTTFTRFNESMIGELKQTSIRGIFEHEFTMLVDFITLPQMIIHWYVRCMMPERCLAIVPDRGYNSGKCGSVKENVWLAYLDKLHEQLEGKDFMQITKNDLILNSTPENRL